MNKHKLYKSKVVPPADLLEMEKGRYLSFPLLPSVSDLIQLKESEKALSWKQKRIPATTLTQACGKLIYLNTIVVH